MNDNTDREIILSLAGEYPGHLTKLLVAALRSDMTAAQAAETCHTVLREVAKAAGMSPDIEVMIRRPGQERHYDDTRCWCVAWEAGPHDWAVLASMTITGTTGKLVEPYYGFDLMFYPDEWA
jgi:hypothetical protein